jgi:hypothetical protein
MHQAGRPVADRRLDDRAGLRGRRPQAREGRVRRGRHRRLGSPHATVEELHLLAKLVRGLGSENIDTALRQAEASATAPPPARRAGWARRSPSCRRWTAPSSSAASCARTIRCSRSAAPGRAPWRGAGAQPARGADDWAMPMAAAPDRRAAGLGRCAGRCGWRRSPPPRACRPRTGRRRRRRQGHRRVAAVGRAQGRAAGQRRAQHPQAVGAAGAGHLDRPADRRHRRLPGRGRQQRGRAAGRRAAGRRWPERRPDAVAADEGLLLLDVEPRSTPPTPPRPRPR